MIPSKPSGIYKKWISKNKQNTYRGDKKTRNEAFSIEKFERN